MDQRNRADDRPTYLPVLGRHAILVTDTEGTDGIGVCCPMGAAVFAAIDGVASIDGERVSIRSFDDTITIIYEGVDTGDHIHRGDLLSAGAFIGQANGSTAGGDPPLRLAATGADGGPLDLSSLLAGATDPGTSGPALATGSALPGPSDHAPAVARTRPRTRRRLDSSAARTTTSELVPEAEPGPAGPVVAVPSAPMAPKPPLPEAPANPSQSSEPVPQREIATEPAVDQATAEPATVSSRPEPEEPAPPQPASRPARSATPESAEDGTAEAETGPAITSDDTERVEETEEADDAGDRLAARRPRPKAKPRRRLT